MTEQEVAGYKASLEAVGIKVFVSAGNDAESHFVNEEHINALYPQLTHQQVAELIDECLVERRDSILEKYINTIYNRRLQDSYRGADKPNAGAIARECTQSFDGNRRGFMHGKIVERALRGKLQAQIGQNIDLCRVTRGIADPTLSEFAEAIWNE